MLSEEALRARVAKQFRVPDVDRVAWGYLHELGIVQDALLTGAVDEVFKWYGRYRPARRVRPAGRATPGRPWAHPQRLIPLDDGEARRGDVFARAVVNEAGAIPAVRGWREATLVDGPMSAEQAHRFVLSPVAATLRREQFHAERIPADHEARILATEDRRDESGWYSRKVIDVNPPGIRFGIEMSVECSLDMPLPILPWADEDGRHREVVYWPKSLLGELHALGVALSQVYPWTPSEAAWFVMTDDPRLDPIDARTARVGYPDRASRGRIELTIEPWVSADTVKRTYRFFQRWMLRGDENESGDNRNVPERNLAVLEFVQERLGPGERANFRELARQWNRNAKAEWRFPPPLDGFKKVYDETRERLLTPAITITGDEPSPDPTTGRLHWAHTAGFRHRNLTPATAKVYRRPEATRSSQG